MKPQLRLPVAPVAAIARAWLVPALLGALLNTATAADFTSTWNSTTGNWSDATKWSTPGAPGTFPNNGSPSPTYDAVQHGGTLTVNVPITIQKFSLGRATLTAASDITFKDYLTVISPGGFGGENIVNGAGVINISGGMTWSDTADGFVHSSIIRGVNTAVISGRTLATDVININGAMTISGTGLKHLDVRAMNNGDGVNLSTVNWTAGTIGFSNGAVFTNKVGAVFDTSHNDQMENRGGTNYFINEGTFTKSGGGGNTDVRIVFDNKGTVNVNSGTLRLLAGSVQTAALAAAAGATLDLNGGTHLLNPGISFTGPGTLRLSSGTFTAGAAITIGGPFHLTAPEPSNSVAFVMNELNGAGVITSNAGMTWTAPIHSNGAWVGASAISGVNTAVINGRTQATDVINVTGGLTLNGTGVKFLVQRAMNHGDGVNPSTANWTAGSLDFATAAVFTNKAAAVFDTSHNGQMANRGGTNYFINEGTFTKSAGTGSTMVNIIFENSGTVNASSGTLAFNGGYTQTGGVLILNGGGVSSGTLAVKGGKIQGGGTISGAVTSSGGTVIIEPGISATSGILAISGDLTLTSGSKLGFDIGGTTPGTGHDQLTEGGSAALNLAGSTLELGLLGTYYPTAVDTFVVVDSHATITGAFVNVANGARLSTLDGRGSFKVNYGSGSTFADKTQVILSDFVRNTPTELTLTTQQVGENLAAGALVGSFAVVDPTPGSTHTFTLVSGSGDSGNPLFQISGTELRTTAVLDFETQSTHSIRARVTSNLGEMLEQTFVIQIVDVPNPADLALSANTIAENLAAGTVVGALSATDQTPGGALTYALVSGAGSTHNARFAIVGEELRTAQVLDFETMTVPSSVRVRVTAESGEFSELVFTISVLDRGPTSLSLSSSTVAEGLPSSTAVGSLSAEITPDGTAVASFSKVGGTGSADNGLFAIDGTTLRTAAVFDHEAAAARSIRLRVTDVNGEVLEQVFVITVTDENDAPTISNITNLTVLENAIPPLVNFTVGDADIGPATLTVTATSSNQTLVPDASLVPGGSDANRTLNIAPAPGEVGSTTITVTVSDGTLTSSDTFVFTVNDIPVITNLKFNGSALTPSLAITASGTVTVEATDDQGITRVEFFHTQGGGAPFKFATDTNAGNGLSGALAVSQLPDGAYTITATAFDAAGAQASVTGGVDLVLAVPAAPVVTAPAGGLLTEQPGVTVTGTANPEARVRVMRDGNVIAGPTPPAANGSFSFSITLSEGMNDLVVLASNRAGDSPAVTRSVEHVREFPQLSVNLGTETVSEDESKVCTVSISPVQTQPVTVLLSSSLSARVGVPVSVTIPANETEANFNLTGVQNELLDPVMAARIFASGAFLRTGSAEVQVLDDDWPVLTLTLESPWVRENDGPQATFALISRDTARAFAQTVFLSSSEPTAATLPTEGVIPANQSSVRVPVAAINDTLTDGAQNTTLRSWVVEVRGGSIVSESVPVALEVQDDESPTLELFVSPVVLHEGGSFTNGGTVRLPAVAAVPTVVTLGGVPDGLVTMPASVTIAAGQLETSFNLSVPSNAAAEAPRPVRLTCSAAGLTSGVCPVTVTDAPLPDLLPTLVQMPTAGESNTSVSVRFRIENRGTAAVSERQVYRLYLSSDRVLGSDTLVAQHISTETLAEGAFFERTEEVRLPQTEGSFFVLAQADTESAVPEAAEDNNLVVSAQALVVTAGYTATASVAGTMFPVSTTVPVTGLASKPGGVPAARLPVKVRVAVNGVNRDVTVTTGPDGAFAFSFQPISGECGNYTVTAAHPAAVFGSTQDGFSIVGIKPVSVPAISFDDGESSSATVLLTNPAGVPLHNLVATLVSTVPGLTVNLTLPPGAVLDGSAPVPLTIEAIGQAGVTGVRTLVIDITTDEGITVRLQVNVTIHPLRPQIVFSPTRISHSVLRGTQKTAVIEMENIGKAATGDLQVLLPDMPMLALATPALIPSLPPGGKTQVNLLITPPADAPLTLTTGQVLLFSPNLGTISIPFDIRVTSDSRGDLTIEVTDEFTYFAADHPMVEGARVRLRDSITRAEVQTPQTTTATGTVVFPLLNEGHYELEVSAPKHATYLSDVLVQPGPDNKQTIFITRQMVSYLWTVTESEVEDRYEIKVDTTFETNVPAPVVTVTPGQVDLKSLTAVGDEMQVDFVVENHGFIAAEHATFRFSAHPWYSVQPLVPELGAIPAKTAITVPTIIRRIGPVPPGLAAQAAQVAGVSGDAAGAAAEAADGPPPPVPCTLSGELAYDYKCANFAVPKTIPIAFSNVDGDCIRGVGSDPGMLPVFISPTLPPLATIGTPAPGRPWFSDIDFALPKSCDCFPTQKKFEGELDLGPVAEALKEALSKALPPPLSLGEVEIEMEGELDIKVCCPMALGVKGTGKAKVTVEIIIGPKLPELDPEFESPEWAEIELEVSGFAGAKLTLTGSGVVTLEKECDKDPVLCATLSVGGGLELGASFQVSATATEKNSGLEFSGMIEATAVLTGGVFASATYCTGKPVEAKAGASVGYRVVFGGELEHDEMKKPFGLHLSQNVTAGDEQPEEDAAAAPQAAAVLAKKADANAAATEGELEITVLPPVHYPGVGSALVLGRPFSETDEELLALALVPTGQSGICAQVKMQLKQNLVLTRQGFEAVLQLINNQPADNLTNIGFSMDIRDANGQPANDRFQLRAPDVTGFGNIDGTGTLAAQGTGSSRWVLVPNDDAAPFVETSYFVGGQISYTEHGRSLTIPVAGVPISVRPNAALRVSYFHQRDVFADDPHTNPIEPAQPFYLGVLVQNDGFGEARHVKLTSGQPEIVDNERGLLVSFQQETAAVNGAPVLPGSALDFGTIAAHGQAVGLFGMRGSLLGLFNSYDASFEHLDGNGDPRLSLLKSTDIYEMNHLVQAARAGDDALPDFLTNDIADTAHLPDTLHHSTGVVEPVSLVANAATGTAPTSATPATTLIASIPGNHWGYVKIADPSNGTMQLIRVLRSDGVDLIMGKNAWVTDRTMLGLGQPAIVENMLHILDFGGTGQYQLTFAAPPADTTPPTSAVAALPAQSPAFIPVTWSGIDAGTLDGFDIFVSDNGSPFTLWRERTTLVGATYSGVLGHTYAFYSIATDLAGNREAAPLIADATTTVSLVNAAPNVTSPGVLHVSEGQTLSTSIIAQDPDGPLLYELLPGAPAGLVISGTGELRWQPGEAHGGNVYSATVRVTDRGTPQLSSESAFTIAVDENNLAPVPVPVSPRALTAGETVVIGLSATDADSPTQTLAWQLVSGATSGLSLDAATGLLSLTTETSPTPRTITATAEVRDNFTPPGVALVPLSFFIAPGGGSTNHPPSKLFNLADHTAKRGITQVVASFDGLFADSDAGDVLSFSVTGNSAPDFVTGTSVNAGARQVVLNLSSAVAGQSIITLQATDIGGLSVQVPLRVVSHPYLLWAYQEFGSPGLDPAREADLWGDAADHDFDGLPTLMEFGFGTDPGISDFRTLQTSGGTLTQRGQPIVSVTNLPTGVNFCALFGRRKDHIAAGLLYHVHFSNDLVTWETWTSVPSTVASDTEIDAVSVPYPFLLTNGKEAQFFRVSLVIEP